MIRFFQIFLVAYLLVVTSMHNVSILFAQETAETEAPLSLEKSLVFRDPFKRPALKQQEDASLKIPELERLSVDDLKLVGVISGTKKNKAMVANNEGKIFIVTEMQKVGNRKGVVTSIEPGIVYVEEKILNILGHEEKIYTSIEFKESKDGKL